MSLPFQYGSYQNFNYDLEQTSYKIYSIQNIVNVDIQFICNSNDSRTNHKFHYLGDIDKVPLPYSEINAFITGNTYSKITKCTLQTPGFIHMKTNNLSNGDIINISFTYDGRQD